MVHIFFESNKTCLSLRIKHGYTLQPLGKVLSFSKQHLGRKEIVQWPKTI
jgi:hypothetical protein